MLTMNFTNDFYFFSIVYAPQQINFRFGNLIKSIGTLYIFKKCEFHSFI